MRTMKGVLDYNSAWSMIESLKRSDLGQVEHMCDLFININNANFLHKESMDPNDKTLIAKTNYDWDCTVVG